MTTESPRSSAFGTVAVPTRETTDVVSLVGSNRSCEGCGVYILLGKDRVWRDVDGFSTCDEETKKAHWPGKATG